ncbi:NADPH-dependent F420 reductase [Paenibacillus mucilaginosus]|uniref:Putative reductase n=1 Tax=Paenibacillus mucilaginosus (strain KNP414) TaxID=1036673 RepID=F8FF40_PAEMK|nr:NAD(P)-binding domain-containing protein [Paenibacillus mucilaginosus]AEI39740.1 putative reductase [Paenibacillus mucilaginosus KNP414]MCG7217402.1 NAD(P)-binding domain-containing protein [Paenibacillus mucilaginosus]WDM29027.1 NAD(P)-binding domain-containing protein [Paenibacillus mucilaginosus]
MTKTISVLGTGNMGKALVKQLSTHGQSRILWGSRNPEEAEQLVRELQLSNVTVCTNKEALQADLIIPAFHASILKDWAVAHKDQLQGKIVVDISNPFNSDFSGFTTSWGESSAEQLQSLLPASAVIGAFKNTFFKVVEEPLCQGQQSDVLVTGNDENAVQTFMEHVKALPFRFLQAGKLENNRTIERFTLLELELAIRYNTYPYISLQIFGIQQPVAAG